MGNEHVRKTINAFLEGKRPKERYTSFDYCYNYFYSFYRDKKISDLSSKENIQMSCLQLGFYLASWGMFRGRGWLLQKSVKNFEPLIKWISNANKELWEIDVDSYDHDQENIISAAEEIREVFHDGDRRPSDTLVTKIMLGVFGNIPAFDTYFSSSFGVRIINKRGLERIHKFYYQNKKAIDNFKIYTLDFYTGKPTKTIYKKAKIIDMIGFELGMKKEKAFE